MIDAAKLAGVKLVTYTSVLRADTSALALATEHKETEAALRADYAAAAAALTQVGLPEADSNVDRHRHRRLGACD